MKVRIYTDKEIQKLKNNVFVIDINYKRQIQYSPVFKLWTIMMRLDFPELSAREIFSKAGFDINILHNKLPQKRIKEWLDNYKKFGVKYFIPTNEHYSSLKELRDSNDTYDDFTTKLLKCILDRLRTIENENR